MTLHERRARVQALYKENIPRKKIASRLGCSEWSVKRDLARLGIHRARRRLRSLATLVKELSL